MIEGLGECECLNPVTYHDIKAFASKPFSGWPAFAADGSFNHDWTSANHYLKYEASVLQIWYIEYTDEYGEVIDTLNEVGQRYVRYERNRWTNDQTKYHDATTGCYWGACNFAGYLPWTGFDVNDFFCGRSLDNYAVPSGGFTKGPRCPVFTPAYDVLSPYKAPFMFLDSTVDTGIDVSYFSYSVSVVGGQRITQISVTFWAGPGPWGGVDVYQVTTTITETLFFDYTLTDCKADQATIAAANSEARMLLKAADDKQIIYVGYNTSGTIVYADLGDESTPFYPVGCQGDVRQPWDESFKVRSHLAYPMVESFVYACNLTRPIIPTIFLGGLTNQCVEQKQLLVETGGALYGMTTYNWPEDSEIGAQTDYDEWNGVEGRAVITTCSLNEAKLITDLTP